MTLQEAYDLLDKAPQSNLPSRVNRFLTEAEAVKIVRDAVATLGQPKSEPLPLNGTIDPIAEKRVWQVYKNQLRPNY